MIATGTASCNTAWATGPSFDAACRMACLGLRGIIPIMGADGAVKGVSFDDTHSLTMTHEARVALGEPVPLEIDGSRYSGSGSIVRQAAAFAALTGRPIRVYNARAGRSRPGLRHQHLRAVEAVCELVDGVVEGASVGSRSFVFRPGNRAPAGRYVFDVGTAGSATMLALAILPLVAVRGEGVDVEIRGGLFQDFAPSLYHLQHVVFPLVARMGGGVEIEMLKPGYVPAGEGVVRLVVSPTLGLMRPLRLERAGPLRSVWGIALSSHLEGRRVSARMAGAARSVFARAGIEADIEELSDITAAQPGAALAVFADLAGGVRLGADEAGARRVDVGAGL